MATIMRDDRHFVGGAARPFLELAASAAARARGIPTPAVVAGAAYRAGPFYRAEIVTELVPEARTLSDVVWGGDPKDREATLRGAGRAVAGLERARVEHRDLNAGNIVLAEDGVAWIIDLDRCRVLREDAEPPVGSMRRRLERSLRKLGALAERPLSASDWEMLRRGYEDPP
jgi:3-deoxy-D-manno-octulosonic acid kinase